jgi:acetyltransferase-like isoleucine patch superfamily enzyme
LLDRIILKIRRGESPFYRRLLRMIKSTLRSRFPVPSILLPVYGLLYHAWFGVLFGSRWALNYFFREPMFRSRCVSIGRRFHLWLLPDITGHTRITIGDDVSFYGAVSITSGRIFDEPRLVIGNRVDIGHNVNIVVNREIVIEDDVKIASGCRFMDTDAHPRNLEMRALNAPPDPSEIKPIRIGRFAWIGQNAFVLKGVTIGEGAIIGVGSVVVTDVPPHSIVMGNPARVVMKNIDRQPGAQPASTLQD